jgi:subtilisin family serine protease
MKKESIMKNTLPYILVCAAIVTLFIPPVSQSQAEKGSKNTYLSGRQYNRATESTENAPKPVRRIVPTKRASPVEWKDNKIVSRILPYPDFISLFIRLPVAHAAVDGNGVKIAVIGLSNDIGVKNTIAQAAPAARITMFTFSTSMTAKATAQQVAKAGNRIAVIPDSDRWSDGAVIELAKPLQDEKMLVVVPSDFSENNKCIETVNILHATGVLTVGRVNRQSMVMQDKDNGKKPFNSRIRDINTDVFSAIGLDSEQLQTNAVASAAGVAALAMEKWPDLTPAEIREKIIVGARKVWQATSIETGQWRDIVSVDPVTTKYTPSDEKAIFRFRALDAAGAVGVDTEIPWFLNMLNIHKAWEITKGQGVTVVVSDQGFHIRHPALKASIVNTAHFGPMTLDTPNQHFHGTDMARILLSVAPEAKIIPVLCSGSGTGEGELADNVIKSFNYAVEQKADIVSASWAGFFSQNLKFIEAVRRAVNNGVVVSWFHYPQEYPGLLRSRFTYSGWGGERFIGFADRFLTDEPGFHPVEIEAGLSGTAPQAAGIAALAKSVNPKLNPREIEKLILNNSTPIGENIRIPDAYKIVLAAKQSAITGK